MADQKSYATKEINWKAKMKNMEWMIKLYPI